MIAITIYIITKELFSSVSGKFRRYEALKTGSLFIKMCDQTPYFHYCQHRICIHLLGSYYWKYHYHCPLHIQCPKADIFYLSSLETLWKVQYFLNPVSSASYNNLFFCAKVSKSNKSWEYGGVKLLFYFGKILSSSNFFVRNCSIKHICGCIVTTFNTAPLLGRPDLWSWSSTTWDTRHQVPSYLLGEATPSWTLWQSDLMLLLCEMYLSLSPPHHRCPAPAKSEYSNSI